jgi:hypothetical protein
MLIAIDSSCIDGSFNCGGLCIVELTECGERSLSKADSTVVRGHRLIDPDLQPMRFEERSHIFEEQIVLEDATREYDRINRSGMATLHDSFDRSCGYATLKGARNLRYRASAETVMDYSFEQRSEIESVTSYRKRIHIQI